MSLRQCRCLCGGIRTLCTPISTGRHDSDPLIRSWETSLWRTQKSTRLASRPSRTQLAPRWFDENEAGQMVRAMKSMDSDFDRECLEYIVPKVVDAYFGTDQEALKAWYGEAVRPPSHLVSSHASITGLISGCTGVQRFFQRGSHQD